jgi:microsomal epoxide hydrolase
MNTVPNYTTPIKHEGTEYRIHFTALFSKNPNAVPLLLLHGWPGNFMEFLPIMEILMTRYTLEKLPYHIIVPSLPGYAFSSPPPLDRDFQLQDIAAIMHELMSGLGFGDGFVVQGGDIGSKVARVMGATYEAVKAVHSKFFHVCSAVERAIADDVQSTSASCRGLKALMIAPLVKEKGKVSSAQNSSHD